MIFDGPTLARATGGSLRGPGPAGPICTDTRALEPGCWFLALIGERFDGHDYVDQALRNGAVGAIVSRDEPAWTRGSRVVVADTTRALQDLGRFARSRFAGPVVGLTGSSGKTTTRALCALALSPLGEVHQTTGNLNTHLGVPLTLVAADPTARSMVVEMGTSSPGEIRFLAELVEPDIRLVVNVGPAHLEELGGLEGVAQEKGALFATARPGDTLVRNTADPRVAAMEAPPRTRVITVGGPDAQIRVLDVERAGPMAMRARFDTPEGIFCATIPAFGDHIALDAALALGVAWAAGAPLQASTAALEQYHPVGMRMAVERLPCGATVLNDAYNANPASMVASLDALAGLEGRKTAVLGDMLELGSHSLAYHRQVASHADGLGLHRVVLVGPGMGAAADCVRRTPMIVADDPETAGRALAGTLDARDVVLLKGSRGARIEEVLAVLRGDLDPGATP